MTPLLSEHAWPGRAYSLMDVLDDILRPRIQLVRYRVWNKGQRNFKMFHLFSARCLNHSP